MSILFTSSGGAEIDGKELDERQMEALVHQLVERGLLPRYLSAAAAEPKVRERMEALGAALERRDPDAAIQALSGVWAALFDLFGVAPNPTLTSARVPTAEDVPGALRKAARLQKEFPVVTLPAYRDPADIEAQAARLEGQLALEGQLSGQATRVQRNITSLSQQADAWLRTLWGLCQAAQATTPGLAQAGAFLDSYFTDAAARAQLTRQLVDRVRSETEQRVTEAVYEDARAEARRELRSELDERFQALLDR